MLSEFFLQRLSIYVPPVRVTHLLSCCDLQSSSSNCRTYNSTSPASFLFARAALSSCPGWPAAHSTCWQLGAAGAGRCGEWVWSGGGFVTRIILGRFSNMTPTVAGDGWWGWASQDCQCHSSPSGAQIPELWVAGLRLSRGQAGWLHMDGEGGQAECWWTSYREDGAGFGAGGGSYRDGISGVVAIFIIKDKTNFA